MKRHLLHILFLLLIFTVTKTHAQTVQLHVTDQTLNEILLDLHAKYDLQLSINSKLSTACKITINQTFTSIDKAIKTLAEQCNLEVNKIGDVYTFRQKAKLTHTPKPTENQVKKKPQKYLYQGEIIDSNSLEPLPFTKIRIENTLIYADENGRFSFKSSSERLDIQLKHLGYEELDTTVQYDSQLVIPLRSGLIALKEIVVSGKRIIHRTSMGDEAGHIKLNDVSATLIPGNNNNILFNHLRLYSGIMAAGESIGDYIVWGSYAGQNQIIYDGITVFNSWGINDDIGRVNPLLIKNIEVYKGGYNVHIGDRIGGIMLIDSKSGDRKRLRGKLKVSDQIASGYLNIPLFKNTSTLQIAGRKSYQLLDWDNILGQDSSFINTGYTYGDFNVKFNTLFKNNDKLEISSIASQDTYQEKLNPTETSTYTLHLEARSVQTGNALKYLKNWKKGGISTFTAAQSYYRPEMAALYSSKDEELSDKERIKFNELYNSISEYSAKLVHDFAANHRQNFQIGLSYIRNQYKFEINRKFADFENPKGLNRLSVYGKDKLQLTKQINLELGLKTDFLLSTLKPYFQPRVNGKYELTDNWNLHLGWGIYHQFLSKTSVFDQFNSQYDFWQTVDGDSLPVLSAMHQVFGLAHLSNKLEFNIEGYYKTTGGILRSLEDSDKKVYYESINARSYGLDVYLKKRLLNHEFWLSYSLSKVTEHFPSDSTSMAPHSQPHELKAAMVLHFSPFHFSLTNVYGSGFTPNTGLLRRPYSRVDLAFEYRFNVKKAQLETGFSILNVFNRKNVRLNHTTSFPDGSFGETSGIPFGLGVFLGVGF